MIDSSSITNDFKLRHANSFDSALSDAKRKPKNEGGYLITRKRTVRFHPLVSTQETLHIKDYTPPEIARCWYNKEELEQLIPEIQEILANPDVLPDDPEYRCAMWRGLEGMTPQGWKRRQEHREAGWTAVKRESLNSSYGSVSYSSIAMAYRLTTQWAVMEAKKRASDEEYFSPVRITTKTKDPKQLHATKLSTWNAHPKRVGTKIQKMFGRITSR